MCDGHSQRPSRFEALSTIDPSQCRQPVAAHNTGRPCALLGTPTAVISGSTDGSLALIPISDSPLSRAYAGGASPRSTLLQDLLSAAAVSCLNEPSPQIDVYSVVSGHVDGTVRVWNLRPERTDSTPLRIPLADGLPISCVLQLVGGGIVMAQADSIHLACATTGALLYSSAAHAAAVHHLLSVATDASTTMATVLSGAADGSVIVWHVDSTWEEPMVIAHRVAAHAAPITALINCGTTFAATAASDGSVHVWSDPTSCNGPFAVVHTIEAPAGGAEQPGAQPVRLLWHPLSRCLVTQRGTKVSVWDASKWCQRAMEVPAYFHMVDGGLAVAAEGLVGLSADGVLLLWTSEAASDGSVGFKLAAEIPLWGPQRGAICSQFDSLGLNPQRALCCCVGSSVAVAAPARDVVLLDLNAGTDEHLAVVEAQSRVWVQDIVADGWSMLCNLMKV